MIPLSTPQAQFGFEPGQINSWGLLLGEELEDDRVSLEFYARLVVLRFVRDYLEETQALVFVKQLGTAPSIFSVVNQQLFIADGQQIDLRTGKKLDRDYAGPVYTSMAVNVREFVTAACRDARQSKPEASPAADAAQEQLLQAARGSHHEPQPDPALSG